MDTLVKKLNKLLPGIKFKSSDSFYWSPKNQTVFYINQDSERNQWSLLHEVSHAILGHTDYKSDFALLQLEVAAWEEAKKLSKKFNISIDEDHIQDCLDTYRDWLHQRSTCPTCSIVCLQNLPNEYNCHNCNTVWHVSSSRFCRPYRLRKMSGINKKSSGQTPQTTFALRTKKLS
ncbi:hypothetical protein KDA00_02385 [Candidatus Saccharibacteria bacterium]|nr:hypothetical protein [Candidatus Saccharibacteria bacterium]